MAIYYVSGDGSNGYSATQAQNPPGSAGYAPWQTLAYALQQVPAGSIIEMRGGPAYSRVVTQGINIDKTPNHVIVRNYPGETVSIGGLSLGKMKYVAFEQHASGGVFRITSGSHLGRRTVGTGAPPLIGGVPEQVSNLRFKNGTCDLQFQRQDCMIVQANGSDCEWDGWNFLNTAADPTVEWAPVGSGVNFHSGSPVVPNNVTFRNCFFDRVVTDGIAFLHGVTNAVLDNNYWYRCATNAKGHPDPIAVYEISDNVQIINNKVRDTARWLLVLTQNPSWVGKHTNMLIQNNDIVTEAESARLYNAPGVVIVNNLFWTLRPFTGAEGLDLRYWVRPDINANAATLNAKLRNNIIGRLNVESGVTFAGKSNNYVKSYGVLVTTNSDGTTNTWPGATVNGPGEFTTPQPTFVNTTTGDYHPAAGSSAINAGTATDAPTLDRDGNARSGTPDIGPYEYEGTEPPPPPPPPPPPEDTEPYHRIMEIGGEARNLTPGW